MKAKARTIDPSKVSESVRKANPHLFGASVTSVTSVAATPSKTNVRRDRSDEDKMTGPERRFFARLNRERRVLIEGGEDIEMRIIPWGIRLRWGGAMHYTPDFLVITLRDSFAPEVVNIRMIEVKGPHIRQRDIVRFKGCREEWRLIYTFEMWQEDREKQWSKIL